MSVEPTATAARERAEAIRRGIDSIAAALQDVPQLIIEARKAEDWKALGYASWDDYVKGEFGTSILKLDRATRKAWTIALSQAGMSTRAIAPVVNASFKTVARDLETVSSDTVNFRLVPRLRWHQDGGRLALDLTGYRAAVRELADIYPEGLQPYVIQLYEDLVISNVYVLGNSRKSGVLDLDKFNADADKKLQRVIEIAGKIVVAWLEDNP